MSFDERRARLEAWMAEKPRQRFDVSPLVRFTDWAHLADTARKDAPATASKA